MSASGGIQTSAPTSSAAERYHSLDGLRGLAAVIVLFHHLALTIPGIAAVYMGVASRPPAVGTATWWLVSTPAHAVIAGPESVIVFFLISGMALALPVLRAPGFDWLAYYPQRVLRLWIPVAAAVALATVVILLAPERRALANSAWLASSSFDDLAWTQPLFALDVLFGDGAINNPLWSLRWEMLFSLALPVFVLLGVLTRRFWGLTLLGSWLLVLVGSLSGLASLQFLPVFLMGVVLAANAGSIRVWVDRRSASVVTALGGVLLVISLLLLVARWMVWSAVPDRPTVVAFAASCTCLGALGLVVLALAWPPARMVLSTRFFRWLGRISFSLYLVHVPIIVGTNALLGQGQQAAAAAVSVAVAVVVAMVFTRFIEQPAHRFSRDAGRWAASRLYAPTSGTSTR